MADPEPNKMNRLKAFYWRIKDPTDTQVMLGFNPTLVT
jgi:hypothetical protein